MITRRKFLSFGTASMGIALSPGLLAQTRETGDDELFTSDSNDTSFQSVAKLPIICVEEHANDPVVSSQINVLKTVPYLKDIGSRFKDNPLQSKINRPALTFLPNSMKLATQSLSSRLASMDEEGISMQVISLSNTLQAAPASSGVKLTMEANDRLAQSVGVHPSRFSAFFNIPWQDPEAAVQEVERCVNELQLPGAVISGRPAPDKFLDDPIYEPVLAKLAQLNVPLFLHPGVPKEEARRAYYDGFNPDVSARLSLFGWGWHHEAGIHVVRLILSGIFDREPNLKVLSGHWGEMVPFFLQRMDDTMPRGVTGLNRSISQTYKEHVWVHPSGMLDDPHFMFIRSVLGIEKILFSIDYPYLTLTGARNWLQKLPIPFAEKEAMAYKNAQALLGLKAQR